MAAGFVIAVDGPAASGKGTVASRLADAYGLAYLDSGLLYRAVGWAVRADDEANDNEAGDDEAGDDEAGDDEASDYETSLEARAVAAARALDAGCLESPALRTRGAGELASRVAVFPEVRAALLTFQRRFAAQPGGAVLDGRDIGTVIAPGAPAKLFVTASPEVRAERRRRQLAGQGEAVILAEVLDDIRRRDARDGARAASPLVQAPDAVLLDTTEMDISASVEAARRIVEAARARWESSRTG